MAAAPNVPGSRAATVARTLSADLRRDIRLSDDLLTVWDVLVGISEAVNGVAASEWDWREAMSRMIDCSGPLIEGEAGNGVLDAIGDGGEFSHWAGRVPDPGFRGFLRRLLGAAAYRDLRDGFVADSVTISSAMYHMIEMAMPAVIAWTDTCDVVPTEQIRRASGQDLVGSTVFNFVVELYQSCGDRLERLTRLPVVEVITEGRTAEYSGLSLDMLGDALRATVSDGARMRLDQMSTVLSRKFQGVADAMEHSADAASQAANSAVELIDRMLRETFSEDYVLGWITENFEDDHDLLRVDKFGRQVPTKRAEVLCFVHGGEDISAFRSTEPVANPTVFHDIVASAIVSVRRDLERLKHTDDGTPEERERMLAYTRVCKVPSSWRSSCPGWLERWAVTMTANSLQMTSPPDRGLEPGMLGTELLPICSTVASGISAIRNRTDSNTSTNDEGSQSRICASSRDVVCLAMGRWSSYGI